VQIWILLLKNQPESLHKTGNMPAVLPGSFHSMFENSFTFEQATFEAALRKEE
jgi:hypothetical protein